MKLYEFPEQTGLVRPVLIPVTTLYRVNFYDKRIQKIEMLNNLESFKPKKARKKKGTKKVS